MYSVEGGGVGTGDVACCSRDSVLCIFFVPSAKGAPASCGRRAFRMGRGAHERMVTHFNIKTITSPSNRGSP